MIVQGIKSIAPIQPFIRRLRSREIRAQLETAAPEMGRGSGLSPDIGCAGIADKHRHAAIKERRGPEVQPLGLVALALQGAMRR
jgi:hypothetical protein